MSRTLVLLAGPSGSGKSRLTGRTDVVGFRLDDFYLDHDAPDLPRTHGMIDWDHVGTFDVDGAVHALGTLLATGQAEVPDYDISVSRRVGWHRVTAPEGAVVVAEGIFSPDLLAACRQAGLSPVPVWLQRPRALVFALRFLRDVREHRKPVPVLIRRGMWLAHRQKAQGRRAIALGFRPMGLRAAQRLVADL